MRLATLPPRPKRRPRRPPSTGAREEALEAYPKTEDGIIDLTEMRRRYVELLNEGVTPRNALKLLHVDPDALKKLCDERPDIRKEIEAAEASVPADAERCFGKAAALDPKVAREYLERRQPEDWKPQSKIVHDVSSWSEDELDAYISKHSRPESLESGDGGEGSSDPEAGGDEETS